MGEIMENISEQNSNKITENKVIERETQNKSEQRSGCDQQKGLEL